MMNTTIQLIGFYVIERLALNWLKKGGKKETADLITFTEETLNGKLHFCAVTGDNKSLENTRKKTTL